MLQGLRLLALFIVSMPTSIVAQVNVVAQPADDGPVVLMVDFDGSPLGDYTMAAFHSDWPDAEWVIGLGTGRAEIVDGAFAYSGRSLRLKYPAGTYGSRNQAIQARIDLPRKFEELYVSYRVRFENGFDFVKGGKLPGLIGGAGNVGGNRPNGSDGWSGRMMWRRGGDAVQYVYHPDQPGTYGEDFRWERRFEPGRWHTVEHRFVMNNPRIHDGILQAWFDGQEAQYVDDLRFRDVDSFAIDQFYISTFFGGGDITWAPAKDEYILFDDIIISTARIHLPPATVVSIPDLRLGLHASLDLDLSLAFVDPAGRALSYAVSSSSPVVTGRVAGARLTLTAVGVGMATIRVTATDPGGLSATQMFTVTVGPAATAPFSDGPDCAWVDASQGRPLHGAADADRRPAERSGSGAVLLDRPGAAGGGDVGPARTSARAAGGAGRSVRSGGAGGAALDGRVTDGGVDPDPGGARDGASRCGGGAGVNISGPAAAILPSLSSR